MRTAKLRRVNEPIHWDRLCAASDVLWRFRRGANDVIVRAWDVGVEVEVCTQTAIDDDDVRTLGRVRFKRSKNLVPHLLATKQGFLVNGWVNVEISPRP